MVLSQHRAFTDTVCWLLLFLLIIGFHTIYLLWKHPHLEMEGFLNYVLRASPGMEGNWPQAFQTILKDSFLYTLALMVVVYANLQITKPLTLDRASWRSVSRYTIYILFTVISSLLFSLVFAKVADWLALVRDKFNFPINIMANFCFSLISTSLVHLRELKKKERSLLKIKRKNTHLKSRLEEVQEALVSAQQALQGVAVADDHLKIGNRTNYQIIHFDQVLFLKGDGNEPRMMLTNGKRPFAGGTIKELEERLPASRFIRIHRSYIINKDKVVGREGQQFIISDPRLDEVYQVPISDSYQQAVQEDQHPNLSFGSESEIDDNPMKPIFVKDRIVS